MEKDFVAQWLEKNKKQNKTFRRHLTTHVKTRDLFEAFGDQILYPSFVDHEQTKRPGEAKSYTDQVHSMTA